MLNAASRMVGSHESEISTDGRTTAAVGDLQYVQDSLGVSVSAVRNYLYCVGCGVKLYSLIMIVCTDWCR